MENAYLLCMITALIFSIKEDIRRIRRYQLTGSALTRTICLILLKSVIKLFFIFLVYGIFYL